MANDNGSNFLAGFFVGAALGAIAALLLAPKSGKEMRESLAEEGKKLRDRAIDAVDEGRRFVESSEVTDTAKKTVKGIKEALSS